MKNASVTSPSRTNKGGTLTLTAISLFGLAVSTLAQNPPVPEIAEEQGFTIPANVQTPIVLKTQPDAACDLHAAGVSDAAHTLRFYANGDGYIKVHVMAKQESQEDAQVQLDCAAAGNVTSYPIRLRAASSPTDSMPAPQTVMPAPEGSKVLPALTAEEAQQLADDELSTRGYPARPDAAASPDQYARWLDHVSRTLTVLPPHSVSRSDISHGVRHVEEGTGTAANWSGYELRGKNRSYMQVSSNWNVPELVAYEAGYTTYSAVWVGIDGDTSDSGPHDLVQAGTEQDFLDLPLFGYVASYSTWTELLPNQPTEQEDGINPNPGDNMQVLVWISNGPGTPANQNGTYACFNIIDWTQRQEAPLCTPLSGTYVYGSEVEWIAERPLVSGTYAELSDYSYAIMTGANYLRTDGAWGSPGTAGLGLQITMFNEDINHHDNKELSSGWPIATGEIFFQWYNFH